MNKKITAVVCCSLLIHAVTAQNDSVVCVDVPEVAAFRSNYPQPLTIATIPSSDTVAQALYNRLVATNNPVLDVAPKGSPAADLNFTGVNYNTAEDPDCWWTQTRCNTPKADGLDEDTYTCDEPRTWGLSFDDGPTCGHDYLYDFLAAQHLKATMYFIGGNVITLPSQAQRALTDGHQVCVHTWSHHSMTSLTNEQAFAELYYTKLAIKQVLGIETECWRPPYGDVDDRIRYIAKFLSLNTDLWQNDTNDWQEGSGNVTKADIDENYQNIIAAANNFNGTIVLTHELNNLTQGEFISQYSNITAVYQHLVPIAVCSNNTHPYTDDSITFPTFDEYLAGTQTPVVQPTVNGSATLEFEQEDDTSSSASDSSTADSSAATSSGEDPHSSAATSHSKSGSAGQNSPLSFILTLSTSILISIGIMLIVAL